MESILITKSIRWFENLLVSLQSSCYQTNITFFLKSVCKHTGTSIAESKWSKINGTAADNDKIGWMNLPKYWKKTLVSQERKDAGSESK